MQSCTATLPHTEHKLPPAGHRIRLKLVSIRPAKTQAHLQRVGIRIKGAATAQESEPIPGDVTQRRDIGLGEVPSQVPSGSAGAGAAPRCAAAAAPAPTATPTPPASAGPATAVSAGMTKEELRSALAGAMFAVDARLSAACGQVEAKLSTRLGGLEASVVSLAAAVQDLQRSHHRPAPEEAANRG